MTARRSSSDPVSRHLKTGERIVWRHRPDGRTLFFNRLPSFVIAVAMTAFVLVIGVNVVSTAIGPDPITLSAWLVLPAAAGLFFLALLSVFAKALRNYFSHLTDSWTTHYALTDQRFIIASAHGPLEYDASYFRITQALGGKTGAQILLFDYGPSGKSGRNGFRNRIAGLPDSTKLKHLIQDTLHT
jgi:hypothetical protein